MATDEGMIESDEYQDWLDAYGDDEEYSDGSRSVPEFMGDDERVWGYDGDTD